MSAAVISDCGRYRYTLHREWLGGEGICLFLMLNPSTADASIDDPTIRRCIKFAQRWGYQQLTVANLFALRSPHPKALLAADDPVGPENDHWLDCLATAADFHVMAWGAHPLTTTRAREVLERHQWYTPYCLGTTADGSPKHPLARGKHRIPDDFEPIPFRERAAGSGRGCGGTGELWTQPPEGHIGSMKYPCPGCTHPDCPNKGDSDE